MINEVRNRIPIPKLNLSKRNSCYKLIKEVYDKLDPSGINSKSRIEALKSLSDKEFEEFMIRMFKDDSLNFILDIVEFDEVREPNMTNVINAAEVLDIPLEDYIALPFLNKDLEYPIVSKVKMIDGYIPMKRMQQTVLKKNSTSINISKRSPTTGQVIGEDKNGKASDMEIAALIVKGATRYNEETVGPRSDGMARKNQFYGQILEKGYCSLDELDAGIEDRTTLNTVNVYLLGMCIKTDLVTDGYILPRTAKNIKNM